MAMSSTLNRGMLPARRHRTVRRSGAACGNAPRIGVLKSRRTRRLLTERAPMMWSTNAGGSEEDKVPAVMHNNHMERQLVVSPVGKETELHIAPVTPISAAASQHLHLGSQDLVRVAGFAAAHGFRLVRFYMADRDLAPLDRVEEDEISDALVSIFEQYDASEVRSALHDEYEGLFVVGIELLSLNSGHRIQLRREGYIDTSVPDEATHLLDRAWRKLRLA